MLAPALIAWMVLWSNVYGVEPEFALAVARVESGTSQHEFRIGKLGRGTYYGPMGIHKCFLNKWPIDDPWENIRVGVRALRGSKMHALRRYNKSCNAAYTRAVLSTYSRYKRLGTCKSSQLSKRE
jgi:hypothetical protein